MSESDRSEYDYEQPVVAKGNTIFFFCEVSNETVRQLCILLKQVSMTNETIKLCIRSDGGDLYAGFAGLDYIRTLGTLGVTIETIAFGLCASSATFLLLGGSKRMMGKNAYLMIHQISDSMGGYYNALKDEMKTNKKLMKHCKELYKEHTTLPEELLETLFTKDSILSSNKCLRYGIVDSVI